MPERDPRRLAAWAAAILVLLLLSAWYLARSRATAGVGAPPVATIAVDAESGGGSGRRVVVDVAGAVKHPGVYRLSSASRVEDALERAGGATRRADLSQVNRAAKLEDGRQILVPARAAGPTAATAGATASAPAAPEQPVNLNTATPEQLDTLDGVGPAMVKKILDYRSEHGGVQLRRRARPDPRNRREAPRGAARARPGLSRRARWRTPRSVRARSDREPSTPRSLAAPAPCRCGLPPRAPVSWFATTRASSSSPRWSRGSC